MANDPIDHTMAGGLRMPEAHKYLALQRTEQLILRGYRTQEILKVLAEENYTESIRTVYQWQQEVYRRWTEEDVEQRPARRDMWRARLEARYRMMLEDLDDPSMGMKGLPRAKLYDAMAKVELLAIKLDGLDAPLRIEHSGTVDIRAMSPVQRRERIEELLKMRAQAMLETSVGEGEMVS